MFSYKMGNFCKKKLKKKNYSLLVKRGKIPLKRGPKAMIALGAPIFCSRHQRVNINEHQIYPKCSVIKWETFIWKSFLKKYSLLVKRGKISLKMGPKSNDCFGGPHFCSRHQRVNINENQIYSKCSVIKCETFIKKNVEKKIFPLGENWENTLKKGPPTQWLLWGPPFFVPDTRGSTLMKIKCLVIKWENFIRKVLKLFLLGEKRENTLKNDCFGGPHFLFQTPEG